MPDTRGMEKFFPKWLIEKTLCMMIAKVINGFLAAKEILLIQISVSSLYGDYS